MNENHWLEVTLEDIEKFLEAMEITEYECDGTAKLIVAAFAKKASDWEANIKQHLQIC